MEDISQSAPSAPSVAGREPGVGQPPLRRQPGGDQAASDLLRALLAPSGLGALPPEQWQAALPALQVQRLIPFVYTQLRRSAAWRELPGFVIASNGLDRR